MSSSHVPNAKIDIAGKEIPMADVQRLEVEEEVNTASSFSIVVKIKDSMKGKWKYIDLTTIKLGAEVKISMGLDAPRPLITGEITALEPHFSEDISTMEIRGYNFLHRLGLEKKIRTFTKVKDSALVSTIAGDWGLSSKAQATSTTYPYIYQNNQNDLEFLLARAKRIRYEVGVKGKTLFFRKGKENSGPVVTLEYRTDVKEFSANLSARYEGSKVTVKGWDAKQKKAIKATAAGSGKVVSSMGASKTGDKMTTSAFKKSSTSVIGDVIVDASEAESIAAAQLNTSIVETVLGEGRCSGNPKVRVGKNIKIKGIGKFSGIYYVTSSRHEIDEEGYYTSFQVRRTGV